MPAPDEPELNELERALAGLQPSAAGFNRDRLMFDAGQAHRRRRLLWPTAAGLMTVVAASLGLVLLLRAEPEPAVRVVYVDRPVPVAPPAPPPPAPQPLPPPGAEETPSPGVLATLSYWRLHEIVVRHSVDELPDPSPTPASTETAPGATPSVWDLRLKSLR